ncbi:MAG: prepilin-type N-terminal cleavage/methylation domain-containing protein [Thermosynechococcaceae cyanobacterium]
MSQTISSANFSTKLKLALLQKLWVQHKFHAPGSPTGFSLVEVLVALMVTMIFVSVTMQIFVSAAFFRARADQFNQAYNWIQEDFETVLYKASQYEAAALPYSTKCSATNPANGLAAGFLTDTTAGLGGASSTVGTRSFGGKSFTLTRTGNYASSANPYKLLGLTYTVTPTDGGPAVADIRTEAVIYAGFKCPE